jgi:hypothetical protein
MLILQRDAHPDLLTLLFVVQPSVSMTTYSPMEFQPKGS